MLRISNIVKILGWLLVFYLVGYYIDSKQSTVDSLGYITRFYLYEAAIPFLSFLYFFIFSFAKRVSVKMVNGLAVSYAVLAFNVLLLFHALIKTTIYNGESGFFLGYMATLIPVALYGIALGLFTNHLIDNGLNENN